MITSLALVALPFLPQGSETLSLAPVHDSTLYEDPNGQLANGAGQYLLAGTTDLGERRRALLRFQILGSLPTHSTILLARLRVHASQVGGQGVPIEAHKVTETWYSGPANPPGDEANGIPAVVSDTTWKHRRYPNLFWGTDGGGYQAQAQDTISVDATGYHDFDVTADVQLVLDTYDDDHGWILLQEDAPGTVLRFDSRESLDMGVRPELIIDYELPVCGSNYCPSSYNSTGGYARMDFEGSCSVLANDLTLVCHSVPNDIGMFFYSAGQQLNGVPFGNGFLCVGGGASPLVRLYPQAAQGNEMRLDLDLSSLPTHGVIAPGDRRYFQLWYRDPAAAGSFFNLSDAIWIQFQ